MQYENKIEFIKNEFKNYYVDAGPESGILQCGNNPEKFKYAGAATHCTNCLCTLVKMINAKNVLEIGSWHYETSSAIGKTIDEMHGVDSDGVVDSFDIRFGGVAGITGGCPGPSSNRVNARFWYPHNTPESRNLEYKRDLPFRDFIELDNEEISKRNIKILKDGLSEIKGNPSAYDLIFIDGDHSAEGVRRDFNIAKEVANKDTLFVIDNIWDIRLEPVRDFFDELEYTKWNFEEWNNKHYHSNMVQDTGIFIL